MNSLTVSGHKAHASLQSHCALRVVARQTSQGVLYSLCRHSNRTQMGLEGAIRHVQLQVNTHHSTWASMLCHAGGLSWHTCRNDEGRGWKHESVSSCLSTVGCQTWTGSPSPPLVQFAALQVSVRLGSAEASLILKKIGTQQKPLSAAVHESSAWVRRTAPPAVWMERQTVSAERTAQDKWGCRSECVRLWSIREMIQLQNSQRRKLSHPGHHLRNLNRRQKNTNMVELHICWKYRHSLSRGSLSRSLWIHSKWVPYSLTWLFYVNERWH